jgi:ferredoxin-nitrite reductase
LPKKFKVAVEVDLLGKRHLIQDVGIVLSHQEDGVAYYDFYVAGGLGREPQPGFLFESNVSENRVIPLLEAIATVYAAGAPAGKRLKHLLRQIGESGFRGLVALQPGATEELPAVMGIPENFLKPAAGERIVVKIAAGELTSEQLITLAGFADRYAEGYLTVTADQDIAFHLQESVSSDAAVGELAAAGFSVDGVNFRVCPGSASCLAGLSATREIAAQLVIVE